MRPLEQMTFAQRFALTVVIVLAILFALAVFGFMTGAWDDAGAAAVPDKTTMKYEQRFIDLDRAALDKAYSEHIITLYRVWMQDATSQTQPGRAVHGANLARKNYTIGMDAIEVRETALKAKL